MTEQDDTAIGAAADDTEFIDGADRNVETAAAAWSQTDDDDVADDDGGLPWRSVIRWAAILLSVAVVTAAGIFLIGAADKKPKPAAAHAPVAATSPTLDGTYRMEADLAHQTQDGAPNPQPNRITWWAFRSQCAATGCVATGTELDATNPQVVFAPPRTAELHFVDGHWQRTAFQTQSAPYPQCLGADEKSVVAGTETVATVWSLDPQPDGTLRGTTTQTSLTNECGHQGDVLQNHLVVTRTGDAPPRVPVADPATVIAPPSDPRPIFGGPELNGTFRVDFDDAHQTIDGRPTVGDDGNTAPEWWVFRSQCSGADLNCVATGFKLNDRQAGAGVAVVLHYADDHWQSLPYIQPPIQCPAGGIKGNDIYTNSRSFTPQPDGALQRGAGTVTLTVLTNECGHHGVVYRTPVTMTRTGDAQPNVTPPDPTLFLR